MAATEPVQLDAFRLSPYMRELSYQSEAAYFGLEHLDAAGKKMGVGDSTPRMFAALQGILGSAQVMAMILWPEPEPEAGADERAYATTRAETLRSELSVRSGHLLASAAVRTTVYRFDRRLDALTGTDQPVRDRMLSLPGNAWHEDPDQPRYLRLLDPISGLAIVLARDELGREQAATLNYRKLVQAVMRIGRDASAWLAEWRKRQYLNAR